jgi:hypothetical protein
MKTLCSLVVLAQLALASTTLAQTPNNGQPPRNLPPHTVRFDLTITDTGGPKPVTKTMTLTMATGFNEVGSIRAGATIPGIIVDRGYNTDKDGRIQPIPPATLVLPLNFDVRQPTVYDDMSVRASVTVEYQPVPADGKTPPTTVRASSTSVFENGKKTVLLQAADPVSDRRTTIEVTATVLK